MKLNAFLDYITNYEIPPEAPDELSYDGYGWGGEGIDYWRARTECTDRGMWAIVTRQLAEALAGWIGDRKALEIMAGAGWLAKALQDEGVQVVATDNGEWDARHSKMRPLTSIAKMEASRAIEAFPDADILLVSWPPYGDEAIVEACKAWGSGRPIVYIGEGEGGCNAQDGFFERFVKLSDEPDIDVFSWDGLHDHVFFGRWRVPCPEE